MEHKTGLTESGRQYAAAYASHYTAKNLREALDLYMGLVAAYPESKEAGYARSQVHNIVTAVVPQQELFDAQAGLAIAHFERPESPETVQ